MLPPLMLETVYASVALFGVAFVLMVLSAIRALTFIRPLFGVAFASAFKLGRPNMMAKENTASPAQKTPVGIQIHPTVNS